MMPLDGGEARFELCESHRMEDVTDHDDRHRQRADGEDEAHVPIEAPFIRL